jgi:hypothetical protein
VGADFQVKRSELKRKTPMPRGTKGLKRSGRLRQKSVKNSHRNRGVIDEYRQQHPQCALCGAPTEEIHHIFAGARARVDIAANLIALCKRFGHGCHTPEIHTNEGKIRCLYWKLCHSEFDATELDAMGSERIAGWLSRNKPEPGALRSQWERLVGECG